MRTISGSDGVLLRTILAGSFLLLLSASFPPLTATATEFIVYPDGSGDYPTIQAAFDAAAESGDSIVLADGTFTGPGNRELELIGKSVTIRSQNGNVWDCVVDLGQYPFGHFENYQGLLRIEAITLRDGSGIGSGGGRILMHGCRFEEMQWVTGGSEFGYSEVYNSTFTGGTDRQLSTEGHAYNCTFTENLDQVVRSWNSTLEGCLFVENVSSTNLLEATTGAMGLGEITVRDCRFIDNTVGEALILVTNSLTCSGSTFAGNSGTGIKFEAEYEPYMGAYLTLRTSTFVDNSDPVACGLLIDFPWNPSLMDLDIHNCIFAFNPQGVAVACMGDFVMSIHCTDIYGNTDGDWVGCLEEHLLDPRNISEDPLFCYEHAEEPYMLEASSPCAPFSPPNEECNRIGAWDVGCDLTYAEETAPATLHARFRAVPNPFRSTTRIVLPESLPIEPGACFEIFDPSGRLVHRIDLDRRAYAGDPMLWDGSDLTGRLLPSGIYYGRLRGTGTRDAEPILIVR